MNSKEKKNFNKIRMATYKEINIKNQKKFSSTLAKTKRENLNSMSRIFSCYLL